MHKLKLIIALLIVSNSTISSDLTTIQIRTRLEENSHDLTIVTRFLNNLERQSGNRSSIIEFLIRRHKIEIIRLTLEKNRLSKLLNERME